MKPADWLMIAIVLIILAGLLWGNSGDGKE